MPIAIIALKIINMSTNPLLVSLYLIGRIIVESTMIGTGAVPRGKVSFLITEEFSTL